MKKSEILTIKTEINNRGKKKKNFNSLKSCKETSKTKCWQKSENKQFYLKNKD